MDFTRLNNGSQPSLNLSKGNVLDLTKQAPALKNCVLGGGWDMAVAGPTADLDLAAFLIEDSGRVTQVPQDVIFFNNMSAPGIRLEGDNRTGEGDGDDERIQINLDTSYDILLEFFIICNISTILLFKIFLCLMNLRFILF